MEKHNQNLQQDKLTNHMAILVISVAVDISEETVQRMARHVPNATRSIILLPSAAENPNLK